MRRYIYRTVGIFGVLLSVAAALSAGSCAADMSAAAPDGRRTGVVRIGASIENVTETRAQGSKDIESGTYYMTYPNFADNETHGVCSVTFYDGIGVTTTSDNKELMWDDVGPLTYDDALTNFFLDNVVPPAHVSDPNETEITFTDDYHPFDAAVYDGDGGYNDLLWGYAFVNLRTKEEINIGIHHYMSRISVIVTVDNSLEDVEAIDFSKGSVKITNVVTKGESYTRTTGIINLGDNPDYTDLELAKEGGWEDVRDEENPRISYYQTKNFVIPPQALRTDDKRPRLVLDVPQPNGGVRTYSGVIPGVMMVDGSPATMAFDREKNLTLKVKISQDLRYIESIVAYVQDWVDKGSFLVSADNVYIGSHEDLMNLIKIYPAKDDDEISKYGYHHTYDGKDEWSFNIVNDLSVEMHRPIFIDEVKGKMAAPLPDFSFDITSHTFSIVDRETGKYADFGSHNTTDYEAAREAEQVLHDLLRKGTVPVLDKEGYTESDNEDDKEGDDEDDKEGDDETN